MPCPCRVSADRLLSAAEPAPRGRAEPAAGSRLERLPRPCRPLQQPALHWAPKQHIKCDSEWRLQESCGPPARQPAGPAELARSGFYARALRLGDGWDGRRGGGARRQEGQQQVGQGLDPCREEARGGPHEAAAPPRARRHELQEAARRGPPPRPAARELAPASPAGIGQIKGESVCCDMVNRVTPRANRIKVESEHQHCSDQEGSGVESGSDAKIRELGSDPHCWLTKRQTREPCR